MCIISPPSFYPIPGCGSSRAPSLGLGGSRAPRVVVQHNDCQPASRVLCSDSIRSASVGPSSHHARIVHSCTVRGAGATSFTTHAASPPSPRSTTSAQHMGCGLCVHAGLATVPSHWQCTARAGREGESVRWFAPPGSTPVVIDNGHAAAGSGRSAEGLFWMVARSMYVEAVDQRGERASEKASIHPSIIIIQQ